MTERMKAEDWRMSQEEFGLYSDFILQPSSFPRSGADMIEVEISNTQNYLRIDQAEIIALVREVLLREGRREASISIALVDQAAIHALNRVHLGHDWPTDVISFPLSTPDDPTLAGELVVSGEMALATASEVGADPRDELALYIVHGLLHLCGHDDHTESDSTAMRRREDELLTDLGYTNPFHFLREGEAPGPYSRFSILASGLPENDVCSHPESGIANPISEEPRPWSG
jgi:probable rRNA maturation factor